METGQLKALYNKYLLPRAECDDKGILHWSDAINAINGIGASHLFDVKLFRVSLHISMKSLLELLYKNRISLKSVRLIFSRGSNSSLKNVAFTPSAESTRKGLLGRTGLKNIWLSHFFNAHQKTTRGPDMVKQRLIDKEKRTFSQRFVLIYISWSIEARQAQKQMQTQYFDISCLAKHVMCQSDWH